MRGKTGFEFDYYLSQQATADVSIDRLEADEEKQEMTVI